MKPLTLREAANRAPLRYAGVLAWSLTLGTLGMVVICVAAWGIGWL